MPANEVCEGYVFTGVCLSTGVMWSLGGSLSREIFIQGDLCPWGVYVTVMCGWYASYWNAFLCSLWFFKFQFQVLIKRFIFSTCHVFKKLLSCHHRPFNLLLVITKKCYYFDIREKLAFETLLTRNSWLKRDAAVDEVGE